MLTYQKDKRHFERGFNHLDNNEIATVIVKNQISKKR